MNRTITATNPFVLMTSPEIVFAQLERSDRLARLNSTICRPLDKPRMEIPAVELRSFDEAIESQDVESQDPDEPSADAL